MSKQKSYKFLYKYMPMQILHKKASLASMKDTYDSLKLGHSWKVANLVFWWSEWLVWIHSAPFALSQGYAI